jgi:Immunoglobulin I-set domain
MCNVTCSTVPPVIDEANIVNNPKVILNRTVLLECPVSGFPPPQVQWLKNGEPLDVQPGITLIGSGRVVEIARVQLYDTARYTCVALNDAGELRRDYDLEVLGNMHFFQHFLQQFPWLILDFLCHFMHQLGAWR